MKSDVPFLSNESIETRANALLADFGKNISPPIPVEEILEVHLGLTLEISDLRGIFDCEDVIGATWIDKRLVVIDESLDPDVNPTMLGRYHYTAAHEIGHWQLHRVPLETAPMKMALRSGTLLPPSVVCRSGRSKNRMERQADRFAACILMPRKLVQFAWERRYKRAKPIALSMLKSKIGIIMRSEMLRRGSIPGGESALEEVALEYLAAPLAKEFGTSRTAMRIRLEKLGLLIQDTTILEMELGPLPVIE